MGTHKYDFVIALSMPQIFVDRERELRKLTINANLTKKGEGRIILIEGPAGIGKTALIDKFLESVLSFEVLRGECTVDSKYIAYDLFSKALRNYGDLKEIRDKEEKRKARDYAQDLVVRPRMILVDEVEKGAGRFIYDNLRREMEGIYFTSRKPNNDGIWLTETQTDLKSVSPINLEFTLLPAIVDFLKKNDEGKVVYIDDLNYLVYINGINAVIDFLHSLYSLVKDRHIIILSGKLEHLNEDEKNKIMNVFDEIVSFHIETHVEKPMSFLVDTGAMENIVNAAIFSTRRDLGYLVGEGDFTASRLEFELFETIKMEIEKGRDVVIDCLQYLIHHHGIRRIYIWLKAIIDYALKFGRKVYVTNRGLTPFQQDIITWLVDESELKKREYAEIEEKQTIKFYDAILDFLDYNSKKRPLMLVLDNLQWADISSLDLLKYLARNIGHSRIMIIGAYRGDEIANDVEASEIIENIIQLENADLIRLRRLPKDAIATIIRSIKEMSDDDLEIIYEKSEGNPLLAMSIVEHIRDGSFIPETIRESVEMELEKIDDRTLKFLKTLAAIGNVAQFDVLESIIPDWRRLVEKVDGKFVKVDDSKVSFLHNIYRDIIYDYASKDEKREIHKKLGDIYESMGDEVKAAYHYYLARERKALDHLIEVADENIKNMAVKNAIDYYRKAMEIAERYRMRDVIYQLYDKLGDLYRISGDYKQALEMYKRSLKYGNPEFVELSIKIAIAYERLGRFNDSLKILMSNLDKVEGRNRAKLLLEIGVVKWHLGEFEVALKYLNQALNEAEKLNDYEVIADVYRNMAIVKYYTSNYENALECSKKALEYALKSGNYDLLANSYNVIGVLYSTMGMHDEALHYYKKYLEISQKLGNYDYISKAYNNIFVAYKSKGDFQKGKEYYIKSFEIALKIGNPRDLALGYNNMAVIEAQDGSFPKALEYMEKSVKYLQEIGDDYTLCSHLINLGNLLSEIGKDEEGEKVLKRALKIAERNDYKLEIVKAKSVLITLYGKMKKYEDSERLISEIERLFERGFNNPLGRLYFLASKIDYYIKIGKLNTAEKDVEDALKIASVINDETYLIGLKEYMARIRCLRGDYNTAIQYFDEVMEYWKKMNVKKSIADVYKNYAECIENKDKNEALKYYRLAREIYRQMEIANLVKKIDEKIRELSGSK